MSRPRRALFLSSPIGLGHVQREVAIARELRKLQPAAVEWVSKNSKDHAEIQEAIRVLDDSSKPFVERVMNRAISQAVAGHSVEEFK